MRAQPCQVAPTCATCYRAAMASNSNAPSRFALDIYLDSSAWKLALYAPDGTTQAESTTIGRVAVDVGGVIAIPLSLRDLGGDAAHELRVFGAGELRVKHVGRASESYPIAALTVASGEVLGQQIEEIVSIGVGITRVSIAWGG